MHATINETRENSWKTGNEHGNGYAGMTKMQEHEKHVNDVQTSQADESQ